jgi:hypothetical protein
MEEDNLYFYSAYMTETKKIALEFKGVQLEYLLKENKRKRKS